MREEVALIFDLDDTLYDRTEPFRRALEEAMGEKIAGDVRAWYRIYSRHSQDMFEANARGEISLEESHTLRIRYAAAEWGISMTEAQEQSYQQAYEKAQREITLSSTMKEMLDWCQSREILMGILTNGPVSNQNRKIGALGLRKWIPQERIFISEAIGYTKPDPGAFHYVEEVLQRTPKDLYMIGDSAGSDIVPAREAGWNTIWLNKNKTSWKAEKEKPEMTVTTEEELLQLIKKIMDGRRDE